MRGLWFGGGAGPAAVAVIGAVAVVGVVAVVGDRSTLDDQKVYSGLPEGLLSCQHGQRDGLSYLLPAGYTLCTARVSTLLSAATGYALDHQRVYSLLPEGFLWVARRYSL